MKGTLFTRQMVAPAGIALIALCALIYLWLTPQPPQSMIYPVLAAVILLALIPAAYLNHRLQRRLNQTTRTMSDIAEGKRNLSCRLNDSGRDEIATLASAFNIFAAKMKGVVDLIMETSVTLTGEAGNMAEKSCATKEQVLRQQSHIAEAVTMIGEITAEMTRVTDNSDGAVKRATAARAEAENGIAVVAATVSNVNDLANEVDCIGNRIATLADAVTDIEQIVNIINTISEQTKLLALNAAIEAARAGEEGRGFAVVADEVRHLSQRIQTETQSVSDNIAKLKQDTSNVVTAIDQGATRARATVEQAAGAGNALNSIMQAIAAITEMNQNIAQAVEMQAGHTSHLNTKISSIGAIADETAQSATHSSQVSHELSLMAGQLQGLIHNFMLTGDKTDTVAPVSSRDTGGEAELF